MRKELTMEEIERRMAIINAREPEEPTADDLRAIEAAAKEDPNDSITLDEYRAQREYSGKLMLRIPRDLHRELIQEAKENGVSLNQYAVYKLSKA